MTGIKMRCFEDVLHEAGWGFYNKFVLFISLFCAFSTSVSVTAITFALPVAVCDIELNRTDIIWMNAALSLGMGVGVISMGLLADVISRKFILSSTLILLYLSSFTCGFCSEVSMFIMCIFMLGVSTSANIAYAKVNLSEILPMKHRGYYLVLFDMFWIFGYLTASCINWAVRCKVPVEYSEHYTSWRMLFAYGCVVSTICICLHGMLQPSPRMLIASNRKVQAYLVLKYIFSLNNSDHSDNYKVLPNELDQMIDEIELNREYTYTCKDQCIKFRYKLWQIIKKLIQLKTVCLIFVISLIRSCLFSGYGMANIWLVKSLHINTTNCHLTTLQFLYLADENTMFTGCNYNIPVTVFRDYILIGSSGFVGLIIFSYIVDKFGRHLPLCIALISCGVASANFNFIRAYTYRYILAVVYMTGYAISNTALDIVIIENLPTCIRATGLAITLFLPNIEATVIHFFVRSECTIYYYVLGAVTVALGVVGSFLPDRKRRPMRE